MCGRLPAAEVGDRLQRLVGAGEQPLDLREAPRKDRLAEALPVDGAVVGLDRPARAAERGGDVRDADRLERMGVDEGGGLLRSRRVGQRTN